MRFILGLVIGVLIVPVFIYCYFLFGYAPVATAAPPIPFEQRLARAALHARIEKEYPRNVPFQATNSDLQHAAHLYRDHCAGCHGLPERPKTATATGMFPDPPELFKGTGVTDDPAGESYWKIANGIRLTGMPAYKASLSEHEMWSVSQLVAGADKLPADVKEILDRPLHEQ